MSLSKPAKLLLLNPRMFVMLNKLKTSPMNCSFCFSPKLKVFVTRRSRELKSSPNLRFGFTCERIRRPGFLGGLNCEGGPSALQGEGEGSVAVHVGNEFQRSMRALSCAPVVISRPSALRDNSGNRALREGTSESIGTCELIVQIGEMEMFHGTSKTP